MLKIGRPFTMRSNKQSSTHRHFAHSHHHAALSFMSLLLGIFSLLSLAGSAVSAIPSISQNYLAERPLPIGSIVSVRDDTVDQVVPASSSTVDNIIGVVINAGSALIALTGDSEQDVQVATNGTVQVLVSNINGDIKRGDHITASPVTGVGMKATSNIRVVGVAQGDLGQNGSRQEVYKDGSGVEQSILVGQVPVLVNVAYYFVDPERTIIPSAIQNVANALAGREVSTLPIILAAAVFLVMLIVVVSIIYSMIRSSIISVGRNPLSQSAIYRDLIQLSALVLGILAVGLIAIYLILTRL